MNGQRPQPQTTQYTGYLLTAGGEIATVHLISQEKSMLRTKMMVGSGCLLTLLVTTGFIFLLRGCLAKFDERSALLPAIVIGNDTAAVVFSIVAFDKTTSYSSGRGFTHKTVNTTYYIQSNDINNGEKTGQQEVKDHADIKQWPVKILGTAGNTVWIFMGELMAFDGFTLAKLCDIAELEKRNPSLAGRFPRELRFYNYTSPGHIDFTATDGLQWRINSNNFLAEQLSPEKAVQLFTSPADSIKTLQKRNASAQDSLFGLYSRKPGHDYNAGKITLTQYHALQAKLNEQRSLLTREEETLRALYLQARQIKQINDQARSAINALERINPGYTQMGTNLDTTNDVWFAMVNGKELSELSPVIRMGRSHDETARRFVATGRIVTGANDTRQLDTSMRAAFKEHEFLDGAFLLDKTTARPLRLPGNAYLVIHKDRIGEEGKVQLTKLLAGGKVDWTRDTGLSNWLDWKLHKNKLIVFGRDRRELTSDECNVLQIINTNDGQYKSYDYFTDKTPANENKYQ
jgi:hypothetical protein